MTVWLYCRVSTAQQVQDGESLGQQERELRGYAMMKGFDEPVMVVERGVSGSISLADRPEGSKMFAALKAGDTVCCNRLDRLFRSSLNALEVLESLRKRKVALHILDLNGDVLSDGMAKMMFTIVSAFAEAERERARSRIVSVKRDQKKRSRYLGGVVPFGYRVEEGALVPVPERQETISRIMALKAEGKSLRAIAAALSEEGVSIAFSTIGIIIRDNGGDRG